MLDWFRSRYKWEYKIIPIMMDDPEETSEFIENSMILDGMGLVGWELIGVYEKCFVMKRYVKIQ